MPRQSVKLEENTLSPLPKDVIKLILTFLDFKSLMVVASLSKFFKGMIDDTLINQVALRDPSAWKHRVNRNDLLEMNSDLEKPSKFELKKYLNSCYITLPHHRGDRSSKAVSNLIKQLPTKTSNDVGGTYNTLTEAINAIEQSTPSNYPSYIFRFFPKDPQKITGAYRRISGSIHPLYAYIEEAEQSSDQINAEQIKIFSK